MKFILSVCIELIPEGGLGSNHYSSVCVFIKHFDLNDIAFKPKMKMKFYLSETVVNF